MSNTFCTHESMKPYDGSLGYEALVCRACGKYFDHNGEHPADEWSTNFLKPHANLPHRPQ
jgi:hypothetical protein